MLLNDLNQSWEEPSLDEIPVIESYSTITIMY